MSLSIWSCFSFSFIFSSLVFIQSPLSPQHINPVEGKGHPIQISDLVQTGCSAWTVWEEYFRRSGLAPHLELPIIKPVPFLFAPHDCSLLSKFPNDNFLKTKKAGASESEKLPDTPACLENKLIILWKLQQKSGALFENSLETQKRHRLFRSRCSKSATSPGKYLFQWVWYLWNVANYC